jgi:hypothetical protein
MNRKDYQAIADVLVNERGRVSMRAASQAITNITRALADVMAKDNPRFDRARFYEAAGMAGRHSDDTGAGDA